MSTLSAANLAGVQVLIIGSGTGYDTDTTALSSSEQSALLNFVQHGGRAIISVNNDTFAGSSTSTVNNSYISPFGLHVTGTRTGIQLASVTSTSSPVTNGPFGLVSSIQTYYPGWLDNLGSNANSLATLNFNGQPMLAVINPGTLGPGSGGVVIYSDSILANTEIPGGVNEYMSADNQTLARNSIAFLSAGGATPNGGTVTFSDQNGALGSATLVGGVAAFTTSSLAAGTNIITASYGGTADFAPSSARTIMTISPLGPVGGTARTRTVLTVQPRPANLGRTVTLTATVKDLQRRGPIPIGSVTFLDGAAILGTAVLRHGKASLRTSSLPLGPNPIRADYMPAQGFAPSNASVVEDVRAHRSRSKAVPAAEIVRRAVPSTSMAISVAGAGAIPVGALTIVGGPTVLGPIAPDQGTAARSDVTRVSTRHIRGALAGTDNGVPGRALRRRQVANQSTPPASIVGAMQPRCDVASIIFINS